MHTKKKCNEHILHCPAKFPPKKTFFPIIFFILLLLNKFRMEMHMYVKKRKKEMAQKL